MKYLSPKKGFLGFDAKKIADTKVVVVPFGLEKTVSYGAGTKNGPKEIIKASHQVELFDEELNKEPYKNIGIRTIKPFPISKKIAEDAFDAAACIGCGACVAACKNASASLFVSAKVSQLSLLPQGQPEREERVKNMVSKMDEEGFGHCTNTGACEAECPKEISLEYIRKLNWEYHRSNIKG